MRRLLRHRRSKQRVGLEDVNHFAREAGTTAGNALLRIGPDQFPVRAQVQEHCACREPVLFEKPEAERFFSTHQVSLQRRGDSAG